MSFYPILYPAYNQAALISADSGVHHGHLDSAWTAQASGNYFYLYKSLIWIQHVFLDVILEN